MIESPKPSPLLSVIVANHNRQRYLEECLNSILNQSYKNLEIVIYDDGSSDGSPAILREYQKRNPTVVTAVFSPVQKGVAFARHQAVLAGRGEYLTTLDSDDFYANPVKLEKELALIQRIREEEGRDVISFSNVMLLKEQAPACLWGTPENIREGWIGFPILCRTCFIPRDFLMKREWYFLAGGYDFRFRLYEDWDLKIRLALRNEFRYTGEVGTAYRRHGRGLSSSPPDEHNQWLRQVFAKNISSFGFFRRRAAKKAFRLFLAGLAKG